MTERLRVDVSLSHHHIACFTTEILSHVMLMLQVSAHASLGYCPTDPTPARLLGSWVQLPSGSSSLLSLPSLVSKITSL